MITREETGLTEEQYDVVQAGKAGLARRVTLRRRNLDFSSHDTFSAIGYHFDVCVMGGTLFRAQNVGGTLKVWKLANEDSGDQTWVACTDVEIAIQGVRPSWGVGCLYYMKGGDLYQATTANDEGTSWTTNQNRGYVR